jgi:16S rRNA pseudouridine516 synthase
MERLDKLLAGTGKWSRREVKALVRQGLVRVDGRLAASAEDKLDPAAAIITVAGETVALHRFTYVMLHKPAGVLTATEDRKQPTVLDLLPPELRRIGLAPVGRLDKDTEGLLLLTNDGELAHRLLSPKYHVDKRYLARVDGELSAADAEAFARGMTLGDGLECLPAGLEVLPDRVCVVTLREGKFHQVKRMLAARGAPVLYLKRLSMGPLTLDDSLAAGAYRLLRAEEISALYRVCGL